MRILQYRTFIMENNFQKPGYNGKNRPDPFLLWKNLTNYPADTLDKINSATPATYTLRAYIYTI